MTRARDTSTTQVNTGGAVSPFVAGKNVVINGAMDYWSRGTTFSFSGVGAGGYTADRWNSTVNGTNTNFTTTQDTSVPTPAFSYSLKTTQTSSAATSVTEYGLRYKIEQQSAQTLTGQYATISFWYKTSQTGSHYVRTSTISGTGSTDYAATFNVPTANTWQLVKFTTSTFLNITAWTGAANSWGAYIDLGFTGAIGGQGTTIPANAYFQITGVQLESGNVATPFARAGGSIGDELALCQRYFQVLLNGSNNAYENFGISTFWSSNRLLFNVRLPVTMRTSPTLTISAASDFVIENGPTGGYVANNWDSFDISPRIVNGSFYCAGGPFTSGYSGRIRSNGTSNSRFYADAEL